MPEIKTNFEKCQDAYEIGATKDQLKIWVQGNRITPEEYQKITGEAYLVQ